MYRAEQEGFPLRDCQDEIRRRDFMDGGPGAGLTRSGPGEIPANKVKHVVIILKENHTFDNYFGTFPGANGARLPRSPNPPARDDPHTHAAWLARQTTAAREQFVEQDIPAYFSYARKFCLCDNYCTDVAGPSTPNHLMLLCADSPIIDNPSRRTPQTIKIDASLPKSLEQSRLTWRSYGGWGVHYLHGGHQEWKIPSGQIRLGATAGNARER